MQPCSKQNDKNQSLPVTKDFLRTERARPRETEKRVAAAEDSDGVVEKVEETAPAAVKAGAVAEKAAGVRKRAEP